MAVAAADFYTYARATGTPLPKTKQEEAKLTPAVNQWKNNQLRRENQGQEGINPGAVAGLTGLAGVGALALAATRGGLRQRVTEAVKPSPGSRVSTGVGGLQQDLGKVTKGRGDTWGEYKESIAPKTKVDERDFVNEAIAKVEADAIAQSKIGEYTPQELTALENRQKFIKTKGEQVRKELVAEGLEEAKGSEALSSNDFLQQQGPNKYIDPEDVTLSPGGNVPKSETVNDQTLNAIDAAEDQQTGRVNQQLQRNEDLDQSQIALMEEIAEDQDRRFGQGLESGEIAPGTEYQAPIDEVAQSLPDGAPVIQSEQRVGVATRPTAQELLDKTKGEIIRVEGPQGQVRYAETRPQPSWVGASSTIPTNEPNLGPNLAESPVGQRIATARKEIIDEQKAMGVKKPKPSIIETELSRQLGKQSHSYGGSYTKLKNQMKLGIEDPRFLTDLDQETKYVGGVELPVAVRNVFDNTATGSRQLKEPYIKPELAQKADIDFRDKKEAINTYWGNAKLEVYQELNPLIKQTDELLEEQNMLLYSLNNQGPSRELSERLGLVNREIKTNQRNINFLENRLSGIERTQTSQLEDTKKWVPKTLTDWKGEGTVIRTKPLLSKNKELITDEGDSLSSLNQATQRVTDVGPEDLEIVPGGLLTGGYPKLISNVPKTDIYTGAVESPIQIASGTSIRGMGGTDLDNKYVPLIQRGTGGDFVSKYIGSGDNAQERILTKGGNILPNTGAAKNVPSGSLVSYRKPAGQRKDNQLNIAVTGGRTYSNYEELSKQLDQTINTLNPAEGTNINIIAGGAKGADALAERYAKERQYGLTVKPANWSEYGDAAGPIRNREMAKLADVGVAFEGGTGTQNMIKTMGEEGKPILNTAEIQQPTAAMRGETGTRVVNIAENIRHLSDPNWLASQGYNLNKTSPQKLVGEYLQRLQSKTGSADLQEFLQTRGQSRPMTIDAGPVVTGPDGITRGEGLRMTPLQVLKLKRQGN